MAVARMSRSGTFVAVINSCALVDGVRRTLQTTRKRSLSFWRQNYKLALAVHVRPKTKKIRHTLLSLLTGGHSNRCANMGKYMVFCRGFVTGYGSMEFHGTAPHRVILHFRKPRSTEPYDSRK